MVERMRVKRAVAIVLVLQLVLSTGCHTIDAAARLARPNPMYELVVYAPAAPPAASPGTRQVEWEGLYGKPPAGVDDLSGIFSRTVRARGVVAIEPGTKLCAAYMGGYPSLRFVVVTPEEDPRQIVFERFGIQEPLLPETPEQIVMAETAGCTHFGDRRTEEVRGDASAVELLLVPVGGGAPIVVTLPPERPLLSGQRWGWLLVAPVFDAVTIVVSVPLLLGLGIWEGIDQLFSDR